MSSPSSPIRADKRGVASEAASLGSHISSRPVPFRHVAINDPFWSPKLQINRCVSIPFQYRQLKESGRIDALRLEWCPGSALPEPHCYWDSDTAKWVEAASYFLALHPDPDLAAKVDEVVDLFVSAQQPDGYLNSRFTIIDPHLRWKNLRDNHELYCAGHLFEAAVAHFEATGNRKLLEVAIRYADYIGQVFGRGEGQLRGYCGHEEIKLGLVRLYRVTQERRFLDLASYFVEERGQAPNYFQNETDTGHSSLWNDLAHYQAHRPVREQEEPVGHAVRAVYLYSAMADLARELKDDSLFTACRRLWENLAQTRLYITGQIGSTWRGEAFTAAYDLPNLGAYCETCAGVGLIFWNHRMLQLDCNSRYADLIERSLYNGVLSGTGLDGKSFFYQNPLANRGMHRRKEWFECSCCPSNMSRLLGTMGDYLASVTPGGIALHLYIGGRITAHVPGAGSIVLELESRYPWEGLVSIGVEVEKPARFEIALRIPGWCRSYTLLVDGAEASVELRNGYAVIEREWRGGEKIEIAFEMPIERIEAHPSVLMNRSQIALQHGPLVYCVEAADNVADIFDLAIRSDAKLEIRYAADLLGGVNVIEGIAHVSDPATWSHQLYRAVGRDSSLPTPFQAIPYFAWANRKPGPMTVWLKTQR